MNVIIRFANDKLLPNDCLNILCVMKFRGEDGLLFPWFSSLLLYIKGSEITTSGTSKPTSILKFSEVLDESEEAGEQGEDRGLLQLLQVLYMSHLLHSILCETTKYTKSCWNIDKTLHLVSITNFRISC